MKTSVGAVGADEVDARDPGACAVCGRLERGHGDVYTRPGGAHYWTRPDAETLKARLRRRVGADRRLSA